uniref:UDP-sugar transporter protein SLC35A4 n=1 Tax=Macrostomum lignano TaxID=282301 RepID=A0A1I8H3M9_9PLAT
MKSSQEQNSDTDMSSVCMEPSDSQRNLHHHHLHKQSPESGPVSSASATLTDSNSGVVKEPYMNPVLFKFLFVVGTLVYSSYTILVHLMEVDGAIPWSSSSMVLITEFTKLFLSLGLYLPEARRLGRFELPSPRGAVLYLVPALLYALNNNLAVLGNLKILTTAVLFRLIIKKPLSQIQWASLFVLFAAGVSNSWGGLQRSTGAPDINKASTLHITPLGLFMISAYCTVSGLAGVYTEYVLKKQPALNINMQNALLYVFGVAVNLLTFAIGGMIMGVIMKFASNISKLFLVSAAMVLTTILSVLIFHLQLNIYFFLSLVFVVVAQYMYNM